MRTAWLLLVLSVGLVAENRPGEPRPEILSWLTLVVEQEATENPKAALQGNVETVSWEQLATRQDTSGEQKLALVASGIVKYDSEGHAIEQIHRESGETRTTNIYKEGLLTSIVVDTIDKHGNQVGAQFQEIHRYDDSRRLVEVKRQRGQKLENHYLSSYDTSGRLNRHEVRQGEKDTLVYVEQFVYSEQPLIVQREIVSPNGEVEPSSKYRLDERGRVVEMWDTEGYHVLWTYDSEGRVIEQLTEPGKILAECDSCPIFGRIQTQYKGVERRQTFFNPRGKAVLQRLSQMERDNSIGSIGYAIPPDARPEDAPDLYRVLSTIVPTDGSRRYVETSWDDHGNWIEKRRYFQKGDGHEPVLLSVHRRKIVYRETL